MGLLDDISLSTVKIDGKSTVEAQEVRALINIMRVGYAHANSSGLISLTKREEQPEFDGESLASKQLSVATKKFAHSLGKAATKCGC